MNKEFISEGCINEWQQLLTDSTLPEERQSSFLPKYLQIFHVPLVLLFGSLNSMLPTNQNNVEAATNGDHREKEILTGTR